MYGFVKCCYLERFSIVTILGLAGKWLDLFPTVKYGIVMVSEGYLRGIPLLLPSWGLPTEEDMSWIPGDTGGRTGNHTEDS